MPTANAAANGVSTVIEAIVTDGVKGPAKVTTELAKSAPALTKLIDTATPTVIETVISEMSDEAFESLAAAVAAVTTQPEVPAVITASGVTPAKKAASPAKKKSGKKAAAVIREAEVKDAIAKLIEDAPPRTLDRPDGYASPAVEAVKHMMASDRLWDIEGIVVAAQQALDAVLAHPGPLSDTDEEFAVELLNTAATTIARALTAIEAKKNSMVPDSVPDGWS